MCVHRAELWWRFFLFNLLYSFANIHMPQLLSRRMYYNCQVCDSRSNKATVFRMLNVISMFTIFVCPKSTKDNQSCYPPIPHNKLSIYNIQNNDLWKKILVFSFVLTLDLLHLFFPAVLTPPHSEPHHFFGRASSDRTKPVQCTNGTTTKTHSPSTSAHMFVLWYGQVSL